MFLRLAEAVSPTELEADVSQSGRLVHPSVLKVLGLAPLQDAGGSAAADQFYVVSEFMLGASVWQIVAAQRIDRLSSEVCLKIVHDALLAAFDARRALSQTSGGRVHRTLFLDTIWVAEFGAVLLHEVGVSELLHRSTGGQPWQAVAEPRGDADVASAGSVLRLLLADQAGSLRVPTVDQGPLASVLARTEAAHPERFADTREMAHALAELTGSPLATEAEVGAALRDVMRDELARQRALLGLQPLDEVPGNAEGATQVFSPSELFNSSERPTGRPPLALVPPGGNSPVHPPNFPVTESTGNAGVPAPAGSRVPGSTAPDFSGDANDATRIFVPVFGERGPADARPASASDVSWSVRPLSSSAPPLVDTQQVDEPKPHGHGPREPWKIAGVALAVVLLIAVTLWFGVFL